MAFNLRGPSQIADGSITETKLADNAVTETKIAADAVIAAKIAANAVEEAKIASNAVTETKIATDAVTIDKTVSAIVTQHFFGTEVELSHTGSVETTVGEFNFSYSGNDNEDWLNLGYSAKLKTSDVLNNASLKIYVDGVLLETATTNLLAYEHLYQDKLSLGVLAPGAHLVELKLVNADPATISTLGSIDVYLAKK